MAHRFLNLLSPADAMDRFMQNMPTGEPAYEVIPAIDALGRVTAKPVVASEPLPPFSRSSMDGYALRASDTQGASDSVPVHLEVIDEVLMGIPPEKAIEPQKCILIHTGGMLPAGADAVVIVENTRSAGSREIEVLRPVAAGENIILQGEDVSEGQEVIPAGTRLRAPEIGGLMALGVTSIAVSRQPKIGILSSGDEVVPPDVNPAFGQVRDVNAYTLGALIMQAGGIPINYGIVEDRLDALRAAAERAYRECDAAILTAGSSVSARDLTSEVISALGKPGVLVHGINIRPGKPTILAMCDGKPVIGLPGNPVSALVIAWLFAVPVVERLLGLQRPRYMGYIQARLTANMPPLSRREEWIPVRLLPSAEGTLAEPIFSKSNLIFSLVRADGLVKMSPESTGMNAGETVQVVLL